jgi:Major Facilitator Superfamily.
MAENKIEKAPVLEVIARQPKEILLSALARMVEQAPFYIFTAFVFAYGAGVLKVPRDLLLTAVLTASVVSFFSVPLFGHLSDRIGRRKMYAIGAVVTAVYGFVYFGLLNTAVPSLIFLAIVLSLIPHDMLYGPQAALIAESFTPRLRYSGARSAISSPRSSRRAGAPDRHGPLRPLQIGLCHRVFILACAVVSLLAAGMKDHANKDVSLEYDRHG